MKKKASKRYFYTYKYTKKELISLLKLLHEHLGRVPKQTELVGLGPCIPSFVKYFGSWKKAVKAAGFKPRKAGRPINEKN